MGTASSRDQIFRLIGKYALLLAGLYVVEYAATKYVFVMQFDEASYTRVQVTTLKAIFPAAISLALNLVTWFIVSADRRRLGVKTSFVDLATILYRPIGVIAFLLYAMNQTSSTANEGADKVM